MGAVIARTGCVRTRPPVRLDRPDDVQFAVLFNTIPIRRLDLRREEGEFDLPVVWVSLPELTVKAVTQSYKTVSVGDDFSVVRFKSGGFEQNIKVDSNGLVVDYPLISKRI